MLDPELNPFLPTDKDVQDICEKIGIPIDWHISEKNVLQHSPAIMLEMEISEEEIPLDIFAQGMWVELEHGKKYPATNITNDHPILTGMINVCHTLNEGECYYPALVTIEETMEKEESFLDLEKALGSRNVEEALTAIEKFEKKHKEN